MFGRRKLIVLITFITLSVMVIVVNRYLSTSLTDNDDFVSSSTQQKEVSRDSEDESETTSTTRLTTTSTTATSKSRKVGFVKSPAGIIPTPYDPFKSKQSSEKLKKNNPEMSRSGSARAVLSSGGSRYIPQHRVVHLDFKGAPPKLSYLKSIFPLLKDAGATALLIEYEDMFPFWGALRNVSAGNALTAHDVQTIQMWAAQNDLAVIPLIQTFGHLEFVLKLNDFKHLREVPIYPQSICPSKEESWNLITQMIDQVVSLHPDSEWIHIGCDEVYQLGQCSKCSERITEANANPEATSYFDGKTLFLDHVHRVASYIRDKKRIIPIMWDDMLRSIPMQTLQNSGIGTLVEPMVWVYVEDIDRFIDSVTWTTYGAVFEHLWSASAFKGAFGERLYSVNIQRHVINNLSWLEVMRRETRSHNRMNFRGIVLTGWSRYDHFAVLCELLPASLPSLVLNLAILTRGGHDFEAVKRAHRILQCGSQKALMTPEELRRNPMQWDLHRCRFPGSSLIGLLSTYNMNRREVEMADEKINVREGWMTSYNVDHKFSSPYRVHEMMRPISYLPGALRSLESQFKKVLLHYFDSFTAEEWLEQHVDPLLKTVDDLNARAVALTSAMTWPRRPLPASGKSMRKFDDEIVTTTEDAKSGFTSTQEKPNDAL